MIKNNVTTGSNLLIFDGYKHVTIANSTIWGNEPNATYFYPYPAGNFNINHSDMEGCWEGEGNFDADPMFLDGPGGSFYLRQLVAGQEADSPCLDARSHLAEKLCYPIPAGGD